MSRPGTTAMPTPPKADIQAAIQALTPEKPLRVWSFIVTLFGDLARARGDELSGADLGILTGRVGIKPASTRVALHRLRKDGWISSRRDGRTSWYFLTDYGRAETIAFCDRVYAPVESLRELQLCVWHILVAPQSANTPLKRTNLYEVPGHPGVHIGLGPLPDLAEYLTISGQIGPVPEWLRKAFSGPDLRRDYAQFEAQLTKVATLLPAQTLAQERAVLRGLIVHAWRRLLLRHPDLPDGFYGSDCRIAPCRERVTSLLDRLGQVTPDDLARTA
ncbi:MAG: PaaX family transcriptional regulator [Rhodobacteraceae bacterium]|nr:PaaX family transcriptional regulator [Paracoccaceae bacterium]